MIYNPSTIICHSPHILNMTDDNSHDRARPTRSAQKSSTRDMYRSRSCVQMKEFMLLNVQRHVTKIVPDNKNSTTLLRLKMSNVQFKQ